MFDRVVCCFLSLVSLSYFARAASSKSDGLALSQPLAIAWRYHTDQTTDFTPAATPTTVFVPLANGVLTALNAADGKLFWRAEAGGEFSAAPVADDRNVYAATRQAED